QEVSLFARHRAQAEAAYPGLTGRRLVSETVRRMINTLILDLSGTTEARVAEVAPAHIDDIRCSPPLARFSHDMREEANQLKAFLHDNLYKHYQVMRMTTKAARIVRELFAAFLDEPRLLPPQYQRLDAQAGADAQARAIADYIAGMTDRYAIREHARLF